MLKFIVNGFFTKLFCSFVKIFYGIKNIKNNVVEGLTQIFSNLTTCLSVIMSIIIIIIYYVKYGVSFKFSGKISDYYYSNIFYIMFFITIITAIIFIYINHFKNDEKKHTIPIIIFTIITLITTGLYTYIALGATTAIPVNEAFATFITFGDPHNGFMLAATIYLVVSLVSLFITFIFMEQWSYVGDILFGCLMFIVILPIFVYFASNIVGVISSIAIGIVLALVIGFSANSAFESLEQQFYEKQQVKFIEEALKRGDKQKY